MARGGSQGRSSRPVSFEWDRRPRAWLPPVMLAVGFFEGGRDDPMQRKAQALRPSADEVQVPDLRNMGVWMVRGNALWRRDGRPIV